MYLHKQIPVNTYRYVYSLFLLQNQYLDSIGKQISAPKANVVAQYLTKAGL